MTLLTLVCKICGGDIPGIDTRRSICDNPECKRLAITIKNRNLYHKKHPARNCTGCGKRLTGNQKKYCADCAKIAKRRDFVGFMNRKLVSEREGAKA